MELINVSGADADAILLPHAVSSGVGGRGFGAGNLDTADFVSPVTLSSDWSRVARLLLLASLAVIGSIGNVFMISAVMIEDHLKKRGNAFIVNVALADLLITGLLIPASAVVILAGMEASLAVCKFQWFLAVLCFMVTVLTLAATAAENYARLCSTRPQPLQSVAITALLLTYWAVCAITSGLQFAFDISFDYCTRKTSRLIPYQVMVGIVVVFMPILLTFFCYVRIIVRVRAARARPSFKPPVTFSWDYALVKTNMYSFALFVIFWLPLGVSLAIGTAHSIPNRIFYNVAWFAMSKSCINNILYCVTNRHFRNAYINLFHYCCCKTTVSFSRRQRGGEGTRPSGDVRVHIIPGYNMYTSPQRAGAVGGSCSGGKRSASCRPGASLSSGGSRDVYEL